MTRYQVDATYYAPTYSTGTAVLLLCACCSVYTAVRYSCTPVMYSRVLVQQDDDVLSI